MNKSISLVFTLATLLGGALLLPQGAAAHDTESHYRVERDSHHHKPSYREHRGDREWYLLRHRELRSHGYRQMKHLHHIEKRKRGHRRGHHQHQPLHYESRRDHRHHHSSPLQLELSYHIVL